MGENLNMWKYAWCWIRGHKPYTKFFYTRSVLWYEKTWECPVCQWKGSKEEVIGI